MPCLRRILHRPCLWPPHFERAGAGPAVVWLENSSIPNNIGHVLHLAATHGRLPGGSWGVEVRVARTRRSLRFLDQKPQTVSAGKLVELQAVNPPCL